MNEADKNWAKMHPVEAVVVAWAHPAVPPNSDSAARREVRRVAPALAWAVERLANVTDLTDRSVQSQAATRYVAARLAKLYGAEGERGIDDAGFNGDERWRIATAIVNELVQGGLI